MGPSPLPRPSRRKLSSPPKPLASPTSLPPPTKRQKVSNGHGGAAADQDEEDGDEDGSQEEDEEAGQSGLRALSLDGSAEVVIGANGKGKGKALESEQGGREAEEWAPVMSKEAKAKLRKKQRLLRMAEENPAELHYDTRGFRNRTIQLKDVRDLVMYMNADERAPNWMLIKNKKSIGKTVVVMIPGITPEALGVKSPPIQASMPFPIASTSASLPGMQKLFGHACPTKAAGERYRMHSCMSTFMSCPMSASAKTRRDDERRRMTLSKEARDPTAYLLSAEAMLEQGYPPTSYTYPVTAFIRQAARRVDSQPPVDAPLVPFEDWRQDDGWIQTPAPPSPSGELVGRELKVLGVDCEMCQAQSGRVLARVSIVDAAGSVIYDTLVKPSEPIVDYVTRFSGMTAERLEGATTTLEEVQRKLAEIIDFDTVLVGHSLECDLRVLKLAHPWVIDTSVIYNHPKGPPFKPSLKWLAQKWLGYEIQKDRPLSGPNGETDNQIVGHDSEEDARAAVELLRMKIEKGPGFGEFQNDSEAIFDRMARGSDPKVAAVVDYGAPGQWNAGRAKTSLGFWSDDEVVDGVISVIDEHDFVFARMMDLAHALGWSTPAASKPSQDGSVPAPSNEAMSQDDIKVSYARLDRNIARLHESLPRGTALIIFTGHCDPREMSRLTQKKAKFDRLFKTQPQSTIEPEDRWMGEDDRALQDAVERCKLGLSFFRVR